MIGRLLAELQVHSNSLEKQGKNLTSIDGRLEAQGKNLISIDSKLGNLENIDLRLVRQTEQMGVIGVELGKHTGNLGRIENELGEHTAKLGKIETGLGEIGDTRKFQGLVRGQVRIETGKPLSGCIVRAFHITDQGKVRLGEDATDAEGSYTIRYSMLPGVKSIHLAVIVFDVHGKALCEPKLFDEVKPLEMVDFVVPIAGKPEVKRGLEGQIIMEHGFPAEKLKLRLYRRDFGGKTTLLDETTTLTSGQYAFSYDSDGKPLSLEVCAVTATNEEVSLSKPLNDLSREPCVVLNLVAPGNLEALAAEYRRLSADLKPHIGRMTKLAEARENAERQDFTILNRATGWDARIIALAAMTERLCADPDVILPQEALYGLLRAGLPSDKLMLAQVAPDVVEQALKAVRDKGIVELNDQQIEDVKGKFTTFANNTRLTIPAPGSHSTYGALLKSSGLPQHAQDKFITIYLNHRGTGKQLWDEVRKAGLDDAQIGKLQLQGKLAFLAGNSEAMTARLLQKRINDPAQLVEHDFHRAEAWATEVFELTGVPAIRRNNLNDSDKKKIEDLIPASYAAEKIEDRLHAYTEDMARKVRLSYPTQVLGRLLETDENFKLTDAHDDTVKLLKNATIQGFRLGKTPVAAFLRTQTGVTADMASPIAQAAAKQQLQTLQRVYQITAGNEAMPVLMSLGMTSAYDVMAYSEMEFMAIYAGKYLELYGREPTQEESRLVFRKAKQVSSVTFNLFTIAKKAASEPPVAGMSAPVKVRESVRKELIKQFPTMESLFGSMDFCECEHCRSVLSPAAYLVDLLQFVDTENFMAQWSAKYGDREYPHKDTSGNAMKPYDVLIERRPDIPNILLTCENTHTVLPYIDIVNEILEYYVANGKLEEKAAHDTGDSTTEELLAEPQNVIREAYDVLREARYPLNLPFDLCIETVRRFCDYFETPLAGVLKVFRPSDDLFAPAQPFDYSAIFIESLGLSPAEAAIFTNPDPLAGNKWHELYGFPADISIQNPTNVGNATLTVTNSEASKLRGGLSFAYFDVSADALSADYRRIETLGAINSGGAGQTLIILDGVWGVSPAAGDLLVCVEPETLRSAKTLSRRLGVTYKEIAEIVQTGFVNPSLTELTLLYKLGVTIPDARLYKDYKPFYEQNRDLVESDRSALPSADQQRFDALSNKVPDTQMTGWEIIHEVAAFEQRIEDLAILFNAQLNDLKNYIQDLPFDKILVLGDPDAGCNFDETTLRYANSDLADDIVYLRINLFVRLWRKLGWSIEETDRALQAFVPGNTPFDTANLDKQPLKSTLIYLAHLKELDEKVHAGKQSRLKLITLWSDIAATGKKPLYAKLFLTPGVLKSGEVEVIADGQTHRLSVFDDPLGRYLMPAGLTKIADQVRHEARLRNVKDANKIDTAPFAGEQKIGLRYDDLGEVQYLTYIGVLSDQEKVRLAALSPSDELSELLDAVQVKSKEFTLIKGHLLALQGALGLTADEISLILKDVGKSLDTAELSLPNASLLYRYGVLAKSLTLSMRELIALKQLSGLNPFTQLHPDPLETLDQDRPFSQTLEFVKVVGEVKDSGLKIEDLEYLLRHHFDETGKYRPDRESTLTLLRSLSEGVRAIRAEYAVPDDPGELSDEVLRQNLGLALPPDVVEPFLAMMNGTVEFTAIKAVESENQLHPTIFIGESAISLLSYNEKEQEQKMVFRGVLFDEQKAKLKDKFNATLNAGEQATFAGLLDDIQAASKHQADEFFVKHLIKQSLNPSVTTGFLDMEDFDLLFEPMPAGLTKIGQQEHVGRQRTRLSQAFFPFIQERLVRQFIIQTMTANTGADPTLLESLMVDERLLATAGSKPLLASFAATGKRGVNAVFFDSVDLSGVAQPTATVVSSADTALKDSHDALGNPLNSANSACFEGYLEVPTPGVYRFHIKMDKQNAEAELRFDHLPDPVFLKGVADVDNKTLDSYLELKPGLLYRFTLDLKNLDGGGACLLVQGEILPKDGISQLTLYPLNTMAEAERSILVLTKALQLIQSLGLSEREIRYLLTHAADFDGLNLSQLPTRFNDDTPEEKVAAAQRFTGFLCLAGYAELKRDLAGGTDDLIDIFEATGTGDPDKVYPFIAKLTRRDEATVKAAARALLVAPAFASEKPLQRLWEVLQVVERFGGPVTSLLEWTRIVSTAATPEERFDIARDLKEATKARFEPKTWQHVAQPIFDKLRRRRRDALAAHVMHLHGFARMEQLYEFFLIDPGMEPVVQTSRIRLAIASVQLFIQRCLLNLELKVHPSTINSKHWEWMKRYRVWEANRKIFLFPENWLEPEFRDDKTHLFAELEGALLQGDVSADLAEDAFLNYLKKLDEMARLDIVAMHIENNPDTTGRTLHVFGRTYSQPHKYFYRRYAHQMWTPWEPVSAEIEGDHLAPVVWRDRLYLFWVTFMDKPEVNAQPGVKTQSLIDANLSDLISDIKATGENKRIDVQLHWSEYLQGEWSTPESGKFTPTGNYFQAEKVEKYYKVIGVMPPLKDYDSDANGLRFMPVTVSLNFDPGSVFIHVSKERDEKGEELGVYIHLRSQEINQAFYLAGRNSITENRHNSANSLHGSKPANFYSANIVRANRYSGRADLKISFQERITTEPGKKPREANPVDILKQNGRYTLLPCDNNLMALAVSREAFQDATNPDAVEAALENGLGDIASFMKPVFYQDNRHTLFVEPNVTERTIEEWREWIASTPQPEPETRIPDRWKAPWLIPEKPMKPLITDPGDPWRNPIGPGALINPIPEHDWLVNPATTIELDGVLIGPAGQTGLEILTAAKAAGIIGEGRTPVNVNPGSGLASGSTVVLTDAAKFEQTGLAQVAGGLNVVGSAGFNAALKNNLNELNRSGFGAGQFRR